MGCYTAIGPCYSCRQLFSFNPVLVPSILIDEIRRPLCKSCVDRVNFLRKEAGTPLIEPLPGAYEPQGDEGDESPD